MNISLLVLSDSVLQYIDNTNVNVINSLEILKFPYKYIKIDVNLLLYFDRVS
jgi:hypothetical protein